MTRQWIRSVAAGAVALSLSAAVAGAQTFSYKTTGEFFSTVIGNCNGTPVCGSAASNLTFTGVESGNIASGSFITLGSFAWTGAMDQTAVGTDVMFTLFVEQMSPTAGTGDFSGYITGSIKLGPTNSSSIIWTPNSQSLTISPVNYKLDFTQGYDGVVIPTFGSTVTGMAVVTPEPGTILLLGTGIAGLGLFGLRRRQQNNV